jgi:pimeloyl-ACP methyl ester carboxylesterase
MAAKRCFILFSPVVLLTALIAQAEDQFFDSAGVKIHYVIEGSGEPVLLIHGFTIDLERQWRAPGVIAALAKDRKVIAYDNRGHGKSDKPHDPKQYGLEMVEDAVRLLDHLQIKRANVVGYSMGATITNNLLTIHPERLISATLGGAAAKLEESDEPNLDEQFAEDIESGRGMTRLAQFLTPPGRPLPTEEQLKAINAGFYGRNDAKALAAVIRGMRDLNVAEAKAKANQLPVLALIGSLDPLTGRVEKMGAKLTGMSTIIIEGADHMTTPGRPEFAKELIGFLDKHRSN